MFMENHHNDGRLAIWCNAPEGAQDVLVRARPERFFVPPYVGHRGWVGMRLEGDVDWGEVAAIVEDAYRAAAPKRVLAALEAASSATPRSRSPATRSRRRRPPPRP